MYTWMTDQTILFIPPYMLPRYLFNKNNCELHRISRKLSSSNFKNKLDKARAKFRKAHPRIIRGDYNRIRYFDQIKNVVYLKDFSFKVLKLKIENRESQSIRFSVTHDQSHLGECRVKEKQLDRNPVAAVIIDSEGQKSYTVVDFTNRICYRCSEQNLIDAGFNPNYVLFKSSRKNRELNSSWYNIY